MRKYILLCVLAALPAILKAQDYSAYYENLPVEMAQVQAPEIPDNSVSIIETGGVGDGITLNTEAFSKAISKLTKLGGGHLVVPAGVWLTGPIMLKDNIDLHLEKNTIIYFSPDRRLYVSEGSSRCNPGIRATKRKNISITGEGTIDGNGAQWRPVKRSKVSDVEWKQYKALGGVEKDGVLYIWDKHEEWNIADDAQKQEKLRADLIRLTDCENVLVQGVTIQNSPRFHLHPCYCENVIIDGVTVRCPWNAQNGDAIDISDCSRVLIVNSIVDAGDDGLCMKSGSRKEGRPWGCEDILIQDNIVYHAHGGFVIGSESIGGMRRIVVRDNRFSGTDTGLRFKSGVGRGGLTEDIFISDIVMTDISGEAIVFQCDYVDRPAGSDGSKPELSEEQMSLVPRFHDIKIERVTCRGAQTGIKAGGIEGLDCIEGIEISDCTILYSKAASDINAADITLGNVSLVPYYE